MDKIVKFVECLIPIATCNIKCSYCYVIQENRRNKLINEMQVSPEVVGKAFAKERWGGTMLVNLCGYGETLAQKDIVEIAKEILKQGHYVNITNNGTMSCRLKEFSDFPKEFKDRLCFAFSLHYVELKKKKLLDIFSTNVNMIRDAGISFLVQLNLCDEYIELEDEIKKYCTDNFGAFPQLALTRREGTDYSIFTEKTEEEYFEHGKSFDSPLFDFTCKNFRVKRKEFCYAGNWSFKLDMATGDLKSCYFSPPFYNIYKNLNEKIPLLTVGNNCGNAYCINSSHFMSLGIIPEISCEKYGNLRDRPNAGWYQSAYLQFVNQKLFGNNKEYSKMQKIIANINFKRFLIFSALKTRLRSKLIKGR